MNREEWNERYRAVPVLWQVDPGPFLGGEIGETPPGVALDLGTGEGRNAIWLAQRGWRVTAVDFSDVAIERGRRLAEEAGVGPSIEWVIEDLADFEPSAAAFDLVLSMFVHPPADQRRVMLARARRALAPGGTIMVVGYDRSHATEGKGGPRDPALLYGADDIARELDGLVIDRAERLLVGEAIDAIVRAHRPDG